MKTMMNSTHDVQVASSGSDRLMRVQTDPAILPAPWRQQGVRDIFMPTTGNAIRLPFLARFCSAPAIGMASIVLAFAWTGIANAQLQGAAGNVRVNIEWNGDVDLDLYVTDPCGQVIEFRNRQESCQEFEGELDVDDLGHGNGNSDSPNAENITWPNGAPVGRYEVRVNYCDPTGDETAFTVTVENGNERTTHRGRIGPHGRGCQVEYAVAVTEFTADESVNFSDITVSRNSPAVDEGSTASFRLEASPPPANPLQVSVSVRETGQFAASGQTGSRTVTIGTNGIGTLSITTEDDAADEPDGEITATVEQGGDYTVSSSGNSVSITVRDNDEAPEGIALSVNPSTVAENERDGSTIEVTASVVGESIYADDRTVTVTVGNNADSASSGEDYASVDVFTITLPAGESSARESFVLATVDDVIDDDDEIVSIEGSSDGLNVTGTSLTIIDDDEPGVTLSANTLTVTEGQEGVYAVSLRSRPNEGGLVIVQPSSSNQYVSFTPQGLTFNSDNWATPQSIVFAVGEGNHDESLTINHAVDGYGDDRDSEAAEGGTVTVSLVPAAAPEPEKEETVRETVAGIAAATVSNVTSNIGARFSAPSAPTGGVSVSVAGTPLSFGSEGPRYGERFGPADVVGEDRWRWRHGTMSADDLLRSGSFTITLGAAEGADGVSPGIGSRVTVWGRGDLQFFESGGDGASGYDGDLVAGYLGADIAMEGGWLAGVAVSRIASEADYTLGGAAGDGGTLQAELTNVHPYVRTALGERSEAWAILGFGMGEVTDSTQDGSESKSDLTMRMLSTGVRHLLESDIGIDLALLGDGSFAMVETEDGIESIDGISADVWRARFGVEASRTRVSSNGKAVTTFLEIAARQDGGDGVGGLGLELSPGLSFTDLESRFALEARGRVLALHSADNHQEYGASLTASVTPSAEGRGLSMALTPRWGAPDNALNDPDRTLFLGDAGSGHSANRLSLNSRIAYGFGAGEGTVSPFAELSLDHDDGRRMRIGSRYSLGSSLDLELSAARNERAFSDAADNSVQLSGRIRF